MKVLYVRNLKEIVTEEKLKEIFGPYGEIERIKKIKDYAFIHFKEREPCMKVLSFFVSSILFQLEFAFPGVRRMERQGN